MIITAVDSSLVRTVAYDVDRELLQIEFHNRSLYQYFHIPKTVYDALLQAPSKGKYFNQVIRQHFSYALVKAESLS